LNFPDLSKADETIARKDSVNKNHFEDRFSEVHCRGEMAVMDELFCGKSHPFNAKQPN